MNSEIIATPPSVSWAQGNSNVFLTFNVECEKPDIKIERKLVSFKGICAPEQKLYEVEIPLYAEIDPEKSSHLNKGRIIEVVLAKEQQDESFWPSLTSDRKKHHWLRVDFNRWQVEGDSSDEQMNEDSDNMFSKPFADDYELNDSSSNEEEDLPDIQ
ncbi:prostaglandin E synthase 3 homolog [Maniola hyperantus]|uniref:prostaglandin E synthase 3 homolog n=1 Tax=Aphantopus hyperantus TaxID=2795564 RepID=UPI0015682171|nr:uncharacterized protein CG16817-like [Maniola hyperantus]